MVIRGSLEFIGMVREAKIVQWSEIQGGVKWTCEMRVDEVLVRKRLRVWPRRWVGNVMCCLR